MEVYYAVYADTMEHRAVAHVGRKVAAAQLLYGDDVAGALVEQAGVGGSFLEELAREVVANAEIPDLGELFVRQHRAVEGSGWLLGNDGPGRSDLPEGKPEPQPAGNRHESVNPAAAIQLTLF